MIGCPSLGCGNCKFGKYDSFHDEWYCDHDPPPEGLGTDCTVNVYERCEYWEDYQCNGLSAAASVSESAGAAGWKYFAAWPIGQ